MNFKFPVLVAITGLVSVTILSACTPNDTTFGGAVRHNYAAQVINPDPEYDEEMTATGETNQAAVERYRTDQVKEPVRETTTQRINRRGGGGSGPN